MKPAVFEYHRPRTLPEALSFLQLHQGRARVLAGGQSLVPMLNMRLWKPEALVDINELDELESVDITPGTVTLGALVRYTTIERAPSIAAALPLLPAVATRIGDRQVRNRGTIGGALAHGDPTGEMALACLVLEATVVAAGERGTRCIPVADLYAGSYATVLEPTEIVVAVKFPRSPAHWAFDEICRKHNDFAVVSAAAVGSRGPDGSWFDVRVGLGGVADTAVRARAAEELLNGTAMSDEQIELAARTVLDVIDPPSDIRASAEYRAHLAPIHVHRLLTRLRDSAGSVGPGDSGDSQEEGDR